MDSPDPSSARPPRFAIATANAAATYLACAAQSAATNPDELCPDGRRTQEYFADVLRESGKLLVRASTDGPSEWSEFCLARVMKVLVDVATADAQVRGLEAPIAMSLATDRVMVMGDRPLIERELLGILVELVESSQDGGQICVEVDVLDRKHTATVVLHTTDCETSSRLRREGLARMGTRRGADPTPSLGALPARLYDTALPPYSFTSKMTDGFVFAMHVPLADDDPFATAHPVRGAKP